MLLIRRIWTDTGWNYRDRRSTRTSMFSRDTRWVVFCTREVLIRVKWGSAFWKWHTWATIRQCEFVLRSSKQFLSQRHFGFWQPKSCWWKQLCQKVFFCLMHRKTSDWNYEGSRVYVFDASGRHRGNHQLRGKHKGIKPAQAHLWRLERVERGRYHFRSRRKSFLLQPQHLWRPTR